MVRALHVLRLCRLQKLGRVLRELPLFGGPRVVGRHFSGRPSEDGHELPLTRSVVGRSSGASLAQTVSRAGACGLSARLPEPVAEALLREGLATLGYHEGEVARFGRRNRGRENVEHRDRDLLAVLLGSEGDDAVPNVLAAETDGISTPRACVEQEVKGEPL